MQGDLAEATYSIEPVFHLAIPDNIHGVDKSILIPSKTWSDSKEYNKTATQLRNRFIDNIHQLLGNEIHDFDGVFEK